MLLDSVKYEPLLKSVTSKTRSEKKINQITSDGAFHCISCIFEHVFINKILYLIAPDGLVSQMYTNLR